MTNQMTIAEALSEGLKTTVLGMLIIFAVLTILMLAIQIMKYVFYKDPKKEVKKQEQLNISVEPAPKAAEENEEEIIAVLTAAVAASLNTSTYNLKIKSYRRIDSAWNKAAIRDNNISF